MDEPDTTPPSVDRATFRGIAFADVTGTMLLEGAVAALYGPLVPTIAARFHISLPEAGLVLGVHFFGALVGVPLGWLAMRRARGSAIVSCALLCLTSGALGVALAASWALFLAGAFAIGVGFGGLSISFNTFLARSPLSGRARRLSVANAGYGAGSVVGPLLVVLARPHNFRFLFAGVAISAVVLSSLTRGIIAPPQTAEGRQLELDSAHRQRRAILITFVTAYVLYVAAETSASDWIASQLHGEGYAVSIGSLVTGGFWLGLALGRTTGGRLYRRFSSRVLVLGGLGAATVTSAVAYSGLAAPYAYLLIGLALALVYPMGLVWFTLLCPLESDGIALIVFFMAAGGIIGPVLESVMVSLTSVHAVPLVIAAIAALDFAVFASARRFAPHGEGPARLDL